MSSTSTENSLLARIADLEIRNQQLQREVDFLRTHTSIAQGIRGETLIVEAISGCTTAYAAGYDVISAKNQRIEVKFSKLNQPNKSSSTKRWNWSKPLGSMDRGKVYDYLVLIGEKDLRYHDDILDDSPYVYFMIPIGFVSQLMNRGRTIGGVIQITTNLNKLRSCPSPPELLRFQCNSKTIVEILRGAALGTREDSR